MPTECFFIVDDNLKPYTGEFYTSSLRAANQCVRLNTLFGHEKFHVVIKWINFSKE